MTDLHYRYSLKMDVPANEFLEETLKELNELYDSLKDFLEEATYKVICGSDERELFKLLQDGTINKKILYKGTLGEVDLELRDSIIYLHVFDSTKPAQLWLIERSGMESSLSWYRDHNLIRVIEEGIVPIKEE